MKPLKQWMSYSNVTATVALFIALGGGAWAALGPNSVGPNAIKKNAVRSQEIDNETIKGKDVRPGTLGANQIADGSVGTAEIGDGAVGAADIGGGAVDSGELADNAVVTDRLANGAVVNSKLADNAIGSGKIANGAVGSTEIQNGAVGKPEIGDDAVGAAEVIDGALGGGEIAGNSLTGAQIDESSLGTVADANTIGGRSFAFGSGDSTALLPDTIVTFPALGAELQTDGDADDNFELGLEVTGAGALNVRFICPGGSTTGSPGGGASLGIVGSLTALCFVWDEGNPAGPGRALIFCAHDASNDRIRCEALRG